MPRGIPNPKPGAAPMVDEPLSDDLQAAVAEAEADEPRLHPILTNAEYRAAQGKAKAKIEADRRKAAMKSVEEVEARRLEMEEGMTSGDPVADEIVNITVDLPEYGAYLGINFTRYYHGQTYKVPRHAANSMKEMMYRMWRHQDEIDGKTLTQFYQRQRATILSPVKGIINAPQAAA